MVVVLVTIIHFLSLSLCVFYRLLRVDPSDNQVPLRDPSTGLCISAAPNESGLLVGLVDPARADRRFDGYSDAAANRSKILTDVFAQGDVYFDSGDLLSRDEAGFFFWRDRTGDTFRWKGENVATSEVAAVVAGVAGVSDSSVYGVSVPGCDGRVGMAAVILTDAVTAAEFDWDSFRCECTQHLPVYSRPVFVRFQLQLALTSTFKHQKSDLVKDGFDPTHMGDDVLFFYDWKNSLHKALDSDLFASICRGEVSI